MPDCMACKVNESPGCIKCMAMSIEEERPWIMTREELEKRKNKSQYNPKESRGFASHQKTLFETTRRGEHEPVL